MRTSSLMPLAAVAALALSAPVTAAPPATPVGRPCDFRAVGSGTSWTAVLAGGPVAAAGGDVSVTCAILLNGWWHADDPAAAATGPATPGAGVLAPTAVTFSAAEDDRFVVCSSVTAGAATWYWNGRGWTADAASACHDSSEAWWLLTEAPPEADPWVRYYGCHETWGFVECGSQFEDAVCSPFHVGARVVPGVVEIRGEDEVYVAGEHVLTC